MSKKKLLNQLENLLADLEQEATFLPSSSDQSLPGWTWESDGQGLYLECSPEVEGVLGIPSTEFIGQPVADFALDTSSKIVIREALASAQFPDKAQVRFVCPDGKILPASFHIFASQVEEDSESPLGARGFVQILQPVVIPTVPPSTHKLPEPRTRTQPAPRELPADVEERLIPPGAPTQPPAPSPLPVLPIREGTLETAPALPGEDHRQASVLEIPVKLEEQKLGFLQIADDTPGRQWSDDERHLVEQVADQLSLALENAKLFQNEQRRANELNTLAEFSRRISQNLDLEEVFATAHLLIGRLMPTESFFISLLDSQKEGFTAAYIIDKNVRQPVASFPATTGFSGYVVSTGQHYIAHDLDLEPPPFELVFSPGSVDRVRSVIAVPLRFSGEIIGALSSQSYQPNAFTDHDLELLETYADHIGIAIQNARLFQQSQETLTETELLYQASAEMNAIQSYDDILALLRKTTVLGDACASQVSILLFNRPWVGSEPPESYDLISRWSRTAILNTHDPSYPVNTWKRILQLLKPDSATLIEAAGSDPRLDQAIIKHYVDRLGAKSLVFVPMNVGGKWIGYLEGIFSDEVRVKEKDARRLNTLASQAAVSIQNLHLLDETRRKASQLETAAEIARDTSGTLALDTLLKRTVNLICNRFGYYHSSVFLLDDARGSAVIREATGEAGEKMKQAAHSFGVGSKSIIGVVTEAGKPLLIGDVSHDSLHQPNPLLPETRSELGIPLKIGNRVIGALDVQATRLNAFSNDDIAVLQTLADQIAVAVDNARSYGLAQQAVQETRQRVQELSVLFNTSQALAGAAMESSEIANIVARRFLELLNIPQCSVSLKDPQEEGRLRFVIDLSRAREPGANGDYHPTGRVGDAYPIARYPAIRSALESLTPVVLQASDPSLDPLTQSYLAQNRIFTLGLIPLVVKGEAIGVIELIAWDHACNFTPEQLNLALTLANAAAVALENARLYEIQLQTAEKLREVDKLKSQFLANMSHELRTPLNSIIGFSRVIIKGIDGPTTDLQQQDLSAIYSAGQHLLNLINDILDISKIEAGKMELSFDNNVNLVDLITSVMSTAAGLVKDKPVKLVKHIDPNLPFVRADTTRLRQVTLNLLSNAAKFTDTGSITVEAGLQTRPDGYQEVIVKVIDTGPGIAPEDQKRLFQPFTQVDETATRKAGGTGLGLSISRLLIEMHGGQIGLESQLGKGSCFYYTLPLPRPEADVSPSAGNTVILAVDDERSILNLYDRYLSEHGYQVVPLTDPFQVVERAKQIQPYAITLDIMMPGRNGWQVLEDLKGDPLTNHIPVIICSILEDQEKGFSLGATDYLTKPILEEDLVEALTRLNSDGSIHEVLVIDDDEDDLRLVQKILQKDEHYHVGLAHSGAEGLVALRTFKPQAVILDLFMPGIDGFTLLETMRADPGLRDVPVIIFTAGELNELSQDQQKRLAQFSQNMLHKGAFKESKLFASIEKALSRFR
jgi:GAF domain-containing protein/CheY-like chemotaxis protein